MCVCVCVCVCVCIYIYIYISAVKITVLTQEIHFFSVQLVKIFNAVNAGVGLVLATPLATAAYVSFFLLI